MVEVLLSVPFLFLFALAMQDFCRGFLSGQRGQRAARHLAWADARREDHGVPAARPSDQELLELHYRSKGGPISSTVAFGRLQQGLTGAFDDAVTGNGGDVDDLQAMEDDSHASFSLADFGRGVIAFLGFDVHGTGATVTQTVSGIRRLTAGATMTARHYVSLNSSREEVNDPPESRRGWWDPYLEIKDAFLSLFD